MAEDPRMNPRAAGSMGPVVREVPVAAHPPMPFGVEMYFADSSTGGRSSSVAQVLEWDGCTYWPGTYKDNRGAICMVAADRTNHVLHHVELYGQRYPWKLELLPDGRLAIHGQSGQLVIPLDSLRPDSARAPAEQDALQRELDRLAAQTSPFSWRVLSAPLVCRPEVGDPLVIRFYSGPGGDEELATAQVLAFGEHRFWVAGYRSGVDQICLIAVDRRNHIVQRFEWPGTHFPWKLELGADFVIVHGRDAHVAVIPLMALQVGEPGTPAEQLAQRNRIVAFEEAIDRQRWRVVLDPKGHRALELADRPLAAGWQGAGIEGTRGECLERLRQAQEAAGSALEAQARAAAQRDENAKAEARERERQALLREGLEDSARQVGPPAGAPAGATGAVPGAGPDPGDVRRIIDAYARETVSRLMASLQAAEQTRREALVAARDLARSRQDRPDEAATRQAGAALATSGRIDSPGDVFIGEIRLFAGPYVPTGWAPCDGQLLPIAGHEALFAVIGTSFGGDGVKEFALPDLRGRVPLHRGQGVGLVPRRVGERISQEPVAICQEDGVATDTPAGLGLTFLIALNGYYPTRNNG